MKYKILSSSTNSELEKQVNQLLILGWQCQGGVSIFVAASGYWSYNQAMVKQTK